MRIIVVQLLLQFVHGRDVKHKNILFLVADDMRPNLGCYEKSNFGFKSAPMRTPNIDALASRSLLLERAYVQESLCSPSRSSILTGRRPDTTRVHDLENYFRHVGGNFTTIPQFFKNRGYRSIGMGKIFHPGAASNNDDPISWSEDYFQAPHNHPEPFNPALPEGEGFNVHSWMALNQTQMKDKPPEDTANTDHAIKKLRELANDKEQPFFLALGLNKPHLPFVFPEEFLELYPMEEVKDPENPYVPNDMPAIAWDPMLELREYEDVSKFNLGKINVTLPRWKVRELRRAYYAAISYADHQLGRVLKELDGLGLVENTVVVFFGDHGYHLGEHAEWVKQTNFEVANRAPLMIHVPGYEAVRTKKLVEFVDIFPTLVEAAGFEPLKTCPLNTNEVNLCTEGASLIPLLNSTDNLKWKEAVFWQYPKGCSCSDLINKNGYGQCKKGFGGFGGSAMCYVNYPSNCLDLHESGTNPGQWGSSEACRIHSGRVITTTPWDCMGYSVLTSRYRYTEWIHIVRLGGYSYKPDWDNPCDYGELYHLDTDPTEDTNLFRKEGYEEQVQLMATRLRDGWRGELGPMKEQ